ncbi:hypothetical protein LAZ67_2003649 [Cordylochernes scorpioides]|uniref:Histone-lysine N-methyltransferase SETMAR n=1 Tax=Cordylochernes scorpioides TaxID=51811 RepID=A0ABY6K5Z9_9ARAC|nr:hypothetical protein LAZ67_2003649 [Cordylochernes scorpioides]
MPGLKDCQIKFYQDNARFHTAQQALAQISRYGWTLMPGPAYSPDMAPSDIHLFGKYNNSLRGITFENDEMLLHEVRGWFRKQDVAFYQSDFVSWKERWPKYAQMEGRPASSVNEKNIAAVKILLEADRHITYHQIEESLDIPALGIRSILNDHLKLRTKYGSLKVKARLCLYENLDPLRRKCYLSSLLPEKLRVARYWKSKDNAPAHRSKVCADYLACTGLKLMEHPPYSPDIAPCEFSLFPHVKTRLKDKRFFCDEDLLRA